MNQPVQQLQGVIDNVYDSRAMSVSGTRIGAPWQKTLADVTTGGQLSVGATVLVQYTTRDSKGKTYNNASSIQVLAAGAPAVAQPTAAAAAYSGQTAAVAPAAKPHHARRINLQYRSADEVSRNAAVNFATTILIANGELGIMNKGEAVVAVTELADVIFAYTTEQIGAAGIKAAILGNQPFATPAATPPVDDAPEAQPAPAPGPSPEAVAAQQAAESAAAEGAAAGSALDAFMQGN